MPVPQEPLDKVAPDETCPTGDKGFETHRDHLNEGRVAEYVIYPIIPLARSPG
jgi:hypothetical protein